MVEFYHWTLLWVLQHQRATLVVTFLTVIATLAPYAIAPKGFLPLQDTASITAVTEAGPEVSFSDMQARQTQVADIRPVLLVRITPRFAEGFWAKVGRVAAETQGVMLPPRKRFKSGFVRLRALCGASEVLPIHPFELDTNVSETATIDEGLYVFDPDALGPHCGTVTFELYSVTGGAKADTRVLDPKILEQIWQDFEPFRAAKD